MLRPALPATSATRRRPHAHTRACTRPLLSFYSFPRVLPYLLPARPCTQQRGAVSRIASRLLFPPCSPSLLSRTKTATRRLPSFSPFLRSSSSLLYPSHSSAPLSLVLFRALSMSLLSLYPSSASLSLPPPLGLPLYPLVTGCNPETNHPRLKPPSHSLRCPEREHLPTLLMFLLSVSSASPAATDANGVVTTTDVALSPSSG